MSEVNRYSDLEVWKALHFGGSTGGWVFYVDYAKLKEENASLKAESIQDAAQLWQQSEELKRLRASSFVTAVPVEHYERVVKAGDLLCFHYISLARKRWPDDPLPSSVTDWNAAKEGKPSA